MIDLINEIRKEQQISPLLPDTIFEQYVDEGKADINYAAGADIDYDEDLQARALLKTYVMYANHKRLQEFREVHVSEYAKLQIKYYNVADLP